MKNLNKILSATLIGLTFTLNPLKINASENLEIDIIENSATMKMEVKNPSSEVIDVYLVNDRDKEIFSKRIGLGETLESQFDLRALKNGSYTLVSEVSNMRFNRIIEVNEGAASLIDSYYSFIPVITREDDNLMVHYVNNGGAEIGIAIESNGSDIFSIYENRGELIYNKTFSLADLSAGNYIFKFLSKAEVHYYEFKVQ